MTTSLHEIVLADALREFNRLKTLCDKAIAQVDDEGFFARTDDEANSIALLVKHLAGNMRSRWTDFLTTDGEKPDRHRDTEFELYEQDGRESLMEYWEQGWSVLFNTVGALRTEDLGRTITIRGEEHVVVQALVRQISHYAYHTGQIILLAKEHCRTEWQSLSIPRGQSEQFRQNPEAYLRAKGNDSR